MYKLEFDLKKEDFEDVLKKSVEIDMSNIKEVDDRDIVKGFARIAAPLLVIIIIFKLLSDGMTFSSDDIAELILSMVLFLIYFGVIFKSLPVLIKKNVS